MHNNDKLTVAAISATSYPGEIETNFENIIKWTNEAKRQEIDLLLFPEMSLTGYWLSQEMHYKAEPLDGPSVKRLVEEVIDIGSITISVGFAESKSNTIFNTQILIGPKGLLGVYRKTHYPFPENRIWTVGNHFPVQNINNFKIGTAICADNNFPEVHRIYGILGVDILLSPYAFGFVPFKTGDFESEKKAIESWKSIVKPNLSYATSTNGYYCISCVGSKHIKDYRARSGEQPKPNASILTDQPEQYFLSGSVMIFGPNGIVVAESPNIKIEEYLIKATVTRETLFKARGFIYNSMKDRRPQIYKILTELP